MAITKNKILIRDNTLSLSAEMQEYWETGWDWDDYDDYDDCSCGCGYCSPYRYEPDYKYMDTPVDNNLLLGKSRGVWRRINPMCGGKLIDMNSIYSKEIMRDKKIDQILGLSIEKPTLGNIFYEEFRDIQRKLDNRGC